MPNINAQMPQAPMEPLSPSASKKRKIGATIAGALIGMNAYYLPVSKDAFIQRAVNITKTDTNNQITILAKIAQEVEKGSVSTNSKIILQQYGLSEDVDAISKKCIKLDKSINDNSSIKKLKNNFEANYDNYRKTPSLMDNASNKAFKAVKQNKFRWGIGIGAAIGLALSLMTSRE